MLADIVLGAIVDVWVSALLLWAAGMIFMSSVRRAQRRPKQEELTHRIWLPVSDRWIGIGLGIASGIFLAVFVIAIWMLFYWSATRSVATGIPRLGGSPNASNVVGN